MKKLNLFFYCLTIIVIISCNYKEEKKLTVNENTSGKQINTDSIELTKLIKQVYKWHNEKTLEDFPYKYHEKQDSIFVGIDWDKYQDNIEYFKQTKFFSKEFLKKHKDIATALDTSIKRADISWRNINDGIPIWETGADNWCGCQDYPEKYWTMLTIDSLIINGNFADFIWTWDKSSSHNYKVIAKKEDGTWKINSLDGFKHFYTVEEYDKIMKDETVK
ncbi:MAG: hypothetical protein J0L86_09340 [Flavobacteriales bacterium]|nr:hypothetical protein [Flavobacteriales bacterium]